MKPIHILLVEDNEGDIQLTKDAFEEAKIVTKLSIAKDGNEAIEFLTKQAGGLEAGLPDFLLLDVNLPKKNGYEVLNYIKAQDNIKHIPVIMLTTSSSEKDINLSYKCYANCYITKPAEADDFLSVITSIEKFWINIARLPTDKTFIYD